MSDYPAFPKIPRLFRNIIITEKIDGTNALIEIDHYTPQYDIAKGLYLPPPGAMLWDNLSLRAGSRTRWLTPGKDSDNFGFAAWVAVNASELVKLGPGRHYGEWWGQGIQRGYGLKEKRFSLFNASRWSDPATRPSCCQVVPTLYSGEFKDHLILQQLDRLRREGSLAAPGYASPEGIIVFHEAAGLPFKVTLDGDEAKG